MKISLGISSRLVQIVKVTVLTMSLFRQFYLKKALNALIRRVNDMLRNLCVINCFGFICNDMITTKYLWKDGIHLQDLGTSILSKNFIEFANNYLLRLRVTQNALQFFIFFPPFLLLSVLLDRLAKVIFKVLPKCCFERVWPGSELIIWYAVCFQPMSSGNKQ